MQKYKLIVRLLVLLTGIPAILSAQTLSGDEKTWLIRNIMRPEAKMMFLMTMEKDVLDLDNLPDKESAKGEVPLPDNEENLKKYIRLHKYEAEPFIRLYDILNDSGRYDEGIKILSKGLTNILERLEKETNNLELANEAVEIYQAVNELGKAKTLLSYFVELNPKNADAFVTLANLETITMDTREARSHINQAYALEPSLINIYVAEALYELYQGLLALNNQKDPSKPMLLSIPTQFLEKAAQEHPDVEAPSLARHGLKLFQIFYSAVLRHTDDFKRLKPFKFILGTQDIKQLRESKAYFQKILNANKKNDFYLQKCLVLAAVIESDLETARSIYEKARICPNVDNDLFRLMSIGEVMQVRFQDAITHMTRSIQVQDNLDDRLFLASLYDEAGDTESSFQTVMQYAGSPDGNLLIGRFGYAVKAGKIQKAIGLHQKLKEIDPLTKRPDFIYYSGVMHLMQGERKMAKQRLITLPEKDRFSENAQRILKHFDLS